MQHCIYSDSKMHVFYKNLRNIMKIDHILIYKVNGNPFFWSSCFPLVSIQSILNSTPKILGEPNLDESYFCSDFSNEFTSCYKWKLKSMVTTVDHKAYIPTLPSWLYFSNLIASPLLHSLCSRYTGCSINTVSLNTEIELSLNCTLVVSSVRFLPADILTLSPSP